MKIGGPGSTSCSSCMRHSKLTANTNFGSRQTKPASSTEFGSSSLATELDPTIVSVAWLYFPEEWGKINDALARGDKAYIESLEDKTGFLWRAFMAAMKQPRGSTLEIWARGLHEEAPLVCQRVIEEQIGSLAELLSLYRGSPAPTTRTISLNERSQASRVMSLLV